MLLASGHSDEARKILDRMGRSNKRDPAYLISNAKVLLDRGDVPGAGRSYREAVRYAKRDPSVRALAASRALSPAFARSPRLTIPQSRPCSTTGRRRI